MELSLKQEEVARRAGISKGFLSDVENGKRSISAEKLLDIARVLSVSVDFLMSAGEVEPSRGEVQVPASLADFARTENLSFTKVLMLLDMQRQILAHRSISRREPNLDNVDWKKFYESVKEFL